MLYLVPALLSAIWSAVMWRRAFRDPRWRDTDVISRQASQGEIENVVDQPVLKDVQLLSRRHLRLRFEPHPQVDEWIVREGDTVIHRGAHPEVLFDEGEDGGNFQGHLFDVEPVGAKLAKPLQFRMHFYPRENYEKAGLSWPDAYIHKGSSTAVARRNRWAAADWAGLSYDDPDCMEAREILGDSVDPNASTLERAEQVFTFLMNKLHESDGCPTDELLDASPLKSYQMTESGTVSAFCEVKSLIYYLFANAVGVATRLVDASGKSGVMHLTGHYVAESWIPEEGAWAYVDPHGTRGMAVRDLEGQLVSTIGIKHMVDCGAIGSATHRLYQPEKGGLVTESISDTAKSLSTCAYFGGDMVLAYKFGYARNRSYNYLRTFLWRPTLTYSPIALPRRHIWKWSAVAIFIASLLMFAVSAIP